MARLTTLHHACIKVEACFCVLLIDNQVPNQQFRGGSAANTSPAQAATRREIPQPSASQECELEPHYFSDHDQMMDN